MKTVPLRDLDPNKYYHCIYTKDPNNIWFTKGKRGIIHIGTVMKGNEKPIFHHLVGLRDSEDCEVRDTTYHEIAWLTACINAGKYIPILEVPLEYSIY